MPSLGMITINALTAADSVIIPVQAQFLPAKGMTQLMWSIDMVRNHTNDKLRIGGIVMTLVDSRTNLAKEVIDTIRMAEMLKGIFVRCAGYENELWDELYS